MMNPRERVKLEKKREEEKNREKGRRVLEGRESMDENRKRWKTKKKNVTENGKRKYMKTRGKRRNVKKGGERRRRRTRRKRKKWKKEEEDLGKITSKFLDLRTPPFELQGVY